MRPTCLIEVPFMCGDGRHPAARGPARGAAALREALDGLRAVAVAVQPPAPSAAVAASLAVNRELAARVRAAIARGERPLVLAGSCDASLGVVAGLGDDGCGVVWIDAHADFNTPRSSESGFFPGMALAVVAGHCHQAELASLGGGGPVPEEAIALLGVRDLSPAAERERLERSSLAVVPWHDGTPGGDVPGVLDALARRVRRVYLHIDLDALDPGVAPGIVDAPVPGGLALADAEAIVDEVRARFDIRATAITTYVPERDQGERTLRAIVRLARR